MIQARLAKDIISFQYSIIMHHPSSHLHDSYLTFTHRKSLDSLKRISHRGQPWVDSSSPRWVWFFSHHFRERTSHNYWLRTFTFDAENLDPQSDIFFELKQHDFSAKAWNSPHENLGRLQPPVRSKDGTGHFTPQPQPQSPGYEERIPSFAVVIMTIMITVMVMILIVMYYILHNKYDISHAHTHIYIYTYIRIICIMLMFIIIQINPYLPIPIIFLTKKLSLEFLGGAKACLIHRVARPRRAVWLEPICPWSVG
jgi:hypothetical protein